jgi:hypothetical protein
LVVEVEAAVVLLVLEAEERVDLYMKLLRISQREH